MTLTCLDCGGERKGKGGTGRCRSCAAKHTQADPAFRARLVAGLRAKKADPAHREVMKRATRRVHDEKRGDPAWQAYKTASGKRLRAQYEADPAAQERNAEQRARVGQKISDHRLGWCPREYRPEYRRLHRIMLAADARRIIEQQIARDRKRADAVLSPFERQMARVAAGAAVVAKFEPRRADHDFTLGGVATGML